MTNRSCSWRWWQVAGWVGLLGIVVPCARAADPVETYHFGTARVGDRLTNRFLLRNLGTERMVVQSATPSCDCTQVVQWPTNVEAGATGVVEILFVPDKVGEVDYRVYVETLAQNPSELEYAIQGVVTNAVRARVNRDWTLYLGTQESEQAIQDPGSVTWVDVRSAEAYTRMRIPGSLQIPVYAVKTKEFLKSRRVVLVDEGYGNSVLEEECRKLRDIGFSSVAIWYGGLNAWRQRGGQLEGEGGDDVSYLPPMAMHDIAFATDWLVVRVGGEATSNRLDESVAIPFDAAKPDEFAITLNAALKARPQITAVLMIADDGEDYRAMAETAAKLDAVVFYLEGGWAAWQAQQQMLEATQHNHTVSSQSTGIANGNVRARSGGCGGCPK